MQPISYLSAEIFGTVLWSLDYLLAITWSVQQGGRPAPPPWHAPLDAHRETEIDLLALLTLWFPDWEPVAWDAVPPAHRAALTAALISPPSAASVLQWAWPARLPAAAQAAVLARWTDRASDTFPAVYVLPPESSTAYVLLDLDRFYDTGNDWLETAHTCQALRTALQELGYSDPEEEA